MSVEQHIANGVLCIPWCPICKRGFWPPINKCSVCNTKIESCVSSKKGTIIEYSSDEIGYFALVEFEKPLRLVCRIIKNGTPKCGDQVFLAECGCDADGYFFNVRL